MEVEVTRVKMRESLAAKNRSKIRLREGLARKKSFREDAKDIVDFR